MIGREKYEFVTGKTDNIIFIRCAIAVDRIRSPSVVYMARIDEWNAVSCKRIKRLPAIA